MRRSLVLAAVGVVLLLAGAASARYLGLPAARQLPSTMDFSADLTGQMDRYDPAAFAAGIPDRIVRPDVPVTATQRIRVIATAGSTAVVSDETTVIGADSTTLRTSTTTWAVDRGTLRAAAAPAGTTAAEHDGLVLGFPAPPRPQDYPYWDPTTKSTATARYLRTELRAERDSYVYELRSTGTVKDPQLFATVPTTLPRSAVLALAARLGPQVQRQIAGLGALLPAQVPLTYTAATTTTFWVDTATGTVLDLNRSQRLRADLPSQFAAVTLASDATLDLAYTADTVTRSGGLAARRAAQLRLVGVALPVALLLLAPVVGLIEPVLNWRRRRETPPSGPTAADAPPPPLGAEGSADRVGA